MVNCVVYQKLCSCNLAIKLHRKGKLLYFYKKRALNSICIQKSTCNSLFYSAKLSAVRKAGYEPFFNHLTRFELEAPEFH